MPTVDPALEAKWKADMEMRVAQTRAMFTAEAAAAMQAAETKWKSETDQRFAIAEEMFKEIYEEQLSAAEAKWRADENQRFAAAREAWMVDARTKGLGGGGDSSLATSIEAALNAKFELAVADIESRLAQREAAIAEARRRGVQRDRSLDRRPMEFQVNADRRRRNWRSAEGAVRRPDRRSRTPVEGRRGERLPRAPSGGELMTASPMRRPHVSNMSACWHKAPNCAPAAAGKRHPLFLARASGEGEGCNIRVQRM
jgi:hypothetical protein